MYLLLYYWYVIGATCSDHCMICYVLGPMPNSLYNLPCICHCIIDMSLGLMPISLYYCIDVLELYYLHCITWKSCQMHGKRGLKVPPPIQSCRSETPELVYFVLYYLGMEHPSYCIIELMYHCIALFHSELSYSHCIINMYSARTNWHKSAVRHMTRMHSSTTQYGFKSHWIV